MSLDKFEKMWAESGILDANAKKWAKAGYMSLMSTRKPYSYGIVDKDGNGTDWFSGDKLKAQSVVDFWNSMPARTSTPYRVVELFYEDDQ